MEAKFSDVEFARRTYDSVVRRTISFGVRFSPHQSLFSAENLDRPRHAATTGRSTWRVRKHWRTLYTTTVFRCLRIARAELILPAGQRAFVGVGEADCCAPHVLSSFPRD
jgi:hypothetical protein